MKLWVKRSDQSINRMNASTGMLSSNGESSDSNQNTALNKSSSMSSLSVTKQNEMLARYLSGDTRNTGNIKASIDSILADTMTTSTSGQDMVISEDFDIYEDRSFSVTQAHLPDRASNMQLKVSLNCVSLMSTEGVCIETYSYSELMHFSRITDASGARAFVLGLVGGRELEFGTNVGFAIGLAIEDTMRRKRIGHYGAKTPSNVIVRKGELTVHNLREMFDKVDVDNSGEIDLREFKQLITDLGISMTALELKQSFREVDEDESGQVDFDEFKIFYMKQKQAQGVGHRIRQKLKSVLSPTKQNYNSLRDLFDAIDIDGNGTVDKDEFAQLVRDIGLNLSQKQLSDTFQTVALNRNINFDFNEFETFYKGTQALSPPAQKLRSSLRSLFHNRKAVPLHNLLEMFEKVDVDNSGALDQGEFDQLVADLGISMTPIALKQSFREVDTDGSGEVDFEEFKAFYMSKQTHGVAHRIRQKLKSVLSPAKQNFDSLRDMFDAIDIDGNGTVDKDEFTQLVRDIGLSMTDEELEETFSAVDSDGNLSIDFSEFETFYNSTATLAASAGKLRSSLQSLFRSNGMRSVQNLLEMFEKVDVDNSGALDQGEFDQLVADLGISMTPIALKQSFREVDTDGSGEVDFEEFKAFYMSKQTHGVAHRIRQKLKSVLSPAKQNFDSLRDMFDAIDIDGNGTVDKDEFTQLVRDIGLSMTDEELEETFSAVASDGNLSIDFSEFETFYASTQVLDSPASQFRSSLQSLFRAKRSRAFLQTMFDTIDSDRSGAIDLDEFALLVKDVGVKVKAADVAEVFKKIDVDASGEIDFDEFVHFYETAKASKGTATHIVLSALQSVVPGRRYHANMPASVEVEPGGDVDLETLRSMFDTVTHGSEGINREEFGSLVSSLGILLTPKELALIFNDVDASGDERIDFEEFKRYYLSEAVKHGAGFQLWTKLRQWSKQVKLVDRADLKELFEMIDTDKSGSINQEEFGQLTGSLGLQLGLVEVGDAFREIDVDGSGSIEFEEFLHFCIQTQTQTTAGGSVRRKIRHWLKAVKQIDNETMKEMFNELDVDNDGVITRLEFQQLLDSIGFQMTPAELAKSFNEIDVDSNGTVDYAEFR
eukprot:SAG11_NODE_174_length_13505_cov_9.126585_13_plen_1110_part_00